MITKKSLIISEAMALNTEKVLLAEAGPVIAGLTELSYDAIPYGENYRDEIVESTLQNTEHNEIMEATTTALADLVKNAYGQINRYGIGYLEAMKNGLIDHVWNRDYWEVATGNLNAKFICIDNDFFTSLVYPTEVRNTTLNFSNVDLSEVRKLGISSPSDEELTEWMKSGHPDINKVLENADCTLYQALTGVFDENILKELFHYNDATFNFSQVKTLDLNAIFQMYFVVTKMYGSEDPIKWLNKGSLTEYRNYISLLWNGLTRYLIQLKAYCEILRNRSIVVVENKKPKIELVNIREGVGAQFTYEVLTGDVVVTYSEAAIKVLEANNYSLTDWMMARILTNNGRGPRDVDNISLMSSSVAEDVNSSFVGRVKEVMVNNKRIICDAAWKSLTISFVNSIPELVELANGKTTKGIAGERIVTTMMEQDDIRWGYHIAYLSESHPEMEIGDVIMASGIVTAFLRAIDCRIAADILKGTEENAYEDKAVDKRKRLHMAIIDVLVNRLKA